MQIDNWFLKKGLSIRFYASEIIGCRRQRKGSIDPETIKKSLSRDEQLKDQNIKTICMFYCLSKKNTCQDQIGSFTCYATKHNIGRAAKKEG